MTEKKATNTKADTANTEADTTDTASNEVVVEQNAAVTDGPFVDQGGTVKRSPDPLGYVQEADFGGK